MRAAGVFAVCVLLVTCAGMAQAQKQCGGTKNCEAHSSCNPEAPWTDVRCPPGTTCTRQSNQVWSCLSGGVPAEVAAMSGAPAGAAGAAGPADAAAGAPSGSGTPNSASSAAAFGGGNGAPRTFPVMTSGVRDEADPATKSCECVDTGLNGPRCFKGVTDYCTTAGANMTVCEAMSGFFNNQNATAAAVASEFFVRACSLRMPDAPSACACLEGAATEACRTATVGACRAKDPMCAALAFGSEAAQESMEAYARYMNDNCGGALAAAQVGLNFTDVTREQFLEKYAKGTAAALAVISGQPLPSVILLPPMQIKVGSLAASQGLQPGAGAGGKAGAPPGGRRRLAQANFKSTTKVLATYQIRSSEADAKTVLEQLNLAAENGGEGLYKALKANGVPVRPSFSVQNGPPLVGAVPRREMAVDKKEPLDRQEAIGIGAGVGAGVAVVGAGAAALVISRKRHNAAAKRAAEAAAAARAQSGGSKAGAAGVEEEQTAAAAKKGAAAGAGAAAAGAGAAAAAADVVRSGGDDAAVKK